MSDKREKIRALVVDDEAAVVTLLCARLTMEGYESKGASNAEEARVRLDEEHFDLVICDLRMPGMTGLELLKEVRVRFPHLAFIICTGEDDVRTGIEAMKQGAADYLVKPLQLDGMMASIVRALDKQRLTIELEQYRGRLEDMVEQRTRQLKSAIARIEHTYDETLAALGGALELRDIETQGHSRRVTHY